MLLFFVHCTYPLHSLHGRVCWEGGGWSASIIWVTLSHYEYYTSNLILYLFSLVSLTGTQTRVSCVKGKYANHLHHKGWFNTSKYYYILSLLLTYSHPKNSNYPKYTNITNITILQNGHILVLWQKIENLWSVFFIENGRFFYSQEEPKRAPKSACVVSVVF